MTPLTEEHTQSTLEVAEPPAIDRTQPLQELTEEVGYLRRVVSVIHDDIDGRHQQLRQQLLAARTKRIKESGVQLLEELASLGFAWRHIAQMIGVSVPAIQKWRRGEGMSPENLAKVAELLATCDLIEPNFVFDVAAWFEIPIMPPVPVRPLDLYAAGCVDLLLDWVSQQERDPEKVLTGFDRNWRERYATEFEVFEADDGHLSLRRKDA